MPTRPRRLRSDRSPAGRALFVTSGVVPRPRAYWAVYAATKAALETMIVCYADETEKTPIRSEPGRAGAVCDLGRRAASARLLGGLCGDQGGARDDDCLLCRRDREDSDQIGARPGGRCL